MNRANTDGFPFPSAYPMCATTGLLPGVQGRYYGAPTKYILEDRLGMVATPPPDSRSRTCWALSPPPPHPFPPETPFPPKPPLPPPYPFSSQYSGAPQPGVGASR